MSEIRILGGRGFNLLERGIVSVSPAAAALYPAARLYDGTSEWPARFGSLTAAPYVQVDVDQYGGTGSMDSWSGGLPAQPPAAAWPGAWTKTGTVVQDSTIYMGASGSSAKISTGSLIFTRWARAGELINVHGYLRGDGTNAIKFRLRNLQTGKYLNSSALWQVAATDAATRTTATFAAFDLSFVVESSKVCLADLVQLELSFTTSAGDGWIDSATWLPSVDWCSIHGHNIDPSQTVTLDYDDNAAFGSAATAATFNARRRVCYANTSVFLAPQRYWRVQFAGTNSVQSGPIWMGEVVLGRSSVAATGFEYPLEVELDRPQVRLLSGAGGETAAATSAAYARRLTLRATAVGRTAWDEFVEGILEATQGGLYPMVLAPEVDGGSESDADLVVLGRLANPVPLRRMGFSSRALSISVREMPFPLVL